LREEGTSFRTLLDETRRDLALAHLASAETSIAQLARLLGFSESRAFHRSFKRWTGRTPRVRDAHGPETPGRAAD
jgi:AraC-like DNA-binding protein